MEPGRQEGQERKCCSSCLKAGRLETQAFQFQSESRKKPVSQFRQHLGRKSFPLLGVK